MRIKMVCRGFKIAKGWEDKGIELPKRATKHSAGYDIKAAEDVVIPKYVQGMKPTLIPTGLKAYCMPDEWYMLANRSSGPKKGLVMPNSIGIIIKKGDCIGQAIFMKYLITDDDNAQGKRIGGFGSSDS